jgi:hypothetical protein
MRPDTASKTLKPRSKRLNRGCFEEIDYFDEFSIFSGQNCQLFL